MELHISYHQNNQHLETWTSDIQGVLKIVEGLNGTDSTVIHIRRGKETLSVLGWHTQRRMVIYVLRDDHDRNLKGGRLLDTSLGPDDGEIEVVVDHVAEIDTHPIYETVTPEVALGVAESFLISGELPPGLTWLSYVTRETWVS